MSRENIQKHFNSHYFKDHPCTDSFVCRNCGWQISPQGAGTHHRNHCPNCLHSLHVDNKPGDRESDCGGIMEPVSVWIRNRGEWALIHRCKRCGQLHSNRISADDNPAKLLSIAMKPVANPPFPIERMQEIMDALMK